MKNSELLIKINELLSYAETKIGSAVFETKQDNVVCFSKHIKNVGVVAFRISSKHDRLYVMKGESFMSEKTTSYEQMMFADYPDIVSICDLQKMLGIGRKAALELAKHPQIHGVIVGNRFRIPKINVIRYMLCDADAS